VLVDHFDITDVATDGQVRQARVQFAISINAQQFSRDSSQFAYFSPPTLSRVVPSSGSSTGGTVVTIHGSNFNATATHILCSFAIGQRTHGPLSGAQWAERVDVSDGTRDSDEAIRCHAPRAAAMLAEPSSSNATNASRAEDFLSGGEGEEGALEDETSSGSTIANRPSNASLARFATTAALKMTLNGRQFAPNSLPFVYFGSPSISSISPACGPTLGGALVRIVGHQLTNGSAYRCRFGASVVNASLIAVTGFILCASPAHQPTGAASLEVSLNAQDFTLSGSQFATYTAPAVTALVPRSGPIMGATLVRVEHGTGSGCDHRCAFGDGREAVVLGGPNGSATLCSSPPLSAIGSSEGGGAHILHVTLNGQQYSHTHASTFDFFEPRVSALVPASGPTSNATLVVVHGSHFSARAEQWRCGFGANAVSATRLNDSAIVCASPVPIANLSTVPLEVSLNGRDYSADGLGYIYTILTSQ
jgi:hypothetical protein